MHVRRRHEKIIFKIGIVKVRNIPFDDNIAVHIQNAVHAFGKVARGENAIVNFFRPAPFGRRPFENIIAESDGTDLDPVGNIGAILLDVLLRDFFGGDIYGVFAGIVVRERTHQCRKVGQIFFIDGG